MTEVKVSDLTVQELKELIKGVVAQTLLEMLGDPDEGLQLRDDFAAELEHSLANVEAGEETISAEKVAAKHGLTW